MKIQELLAQVKKLSEFDSKSVTRKINTGRYLEEEYMESEHLLPDNRLEFVRGARYQHAQDAKIIEKLIEVIKTQHEALEFYGKQNSWYENPLGSDWSVISPHDLESLEDNSHWLTGGGTARAAIEATLHKLESIK